jgi:4-hydroxybenzoate polyprenyltransferase
MGFYFVITSCATMAIREYLKLARSFNAVLTGMSPVMGAIAMQQYDILFLFILFLIGFFGHTFGFVFNDILDYKIDKSSREISDRPLISGTISIRKAWLFAFLAMAISFALAIYIAVINRNFLPVLILAASAFFIALYDLISKKLPFMDIFVALGVFFLILYGATANATDLASVTKIAWIVCVLGSLQVLYMQFIAGGLKDIENDFGSGAKTAAIKLGVRIQNGELKISNSFKALAYGLQVLDIIVVFLPFFIIWGVSTLSIFQYAQWMVIILIGLVMFFLSYRLLSMKKFKRSKARKYIGSHYMINFMIVPIMLMSLNPWAGILMFFPGLGFILSNLILHGTIAQPKTM